MSIAGRIIYALYHRPLGAMRSSIRHGGPWVERQTERNRSAMEEAARLLPSLTLPTAPARYTVHLMTGRRFWYQTAFCVYTLAAHADMAINVEIYDDGTLTNEYCDLLLRLGLPVRFHPASDLKAKFDEALPPGRFPVLRERWVNYPNIRKVIDVHAGSTGSKLVIDSDLLFFRKPQVLLDWMAAPTSPLHAVDCVESYGYTRPLMERLAGFPIGHKVNVGLCGLDGGALDWDRLEAWTSELIAKERTNYLLEQALVAMQVAGRTCVIAPEKDYLTLPDRQEVTHPTAVMHHYVDTAKRWYFGMGWRNALSRLRLPKQ